MSEKERHVVRRGADWVVKKPHAERVSSIHDTQRDAIDRAREIAERTGGEVVIHNQHGKIRDKDSYGPDPNPPKDTRH
ncbi:MAG TPA: DUF2188 domain-containing protein [Candidatus Polarisedimenticolia bacterium]|jgi:uncharacterized protein YdaT|nr:DUF2188 domain-containing protein [Candidatus Polarisedimenticolia bacterium]